MKSIISCIVVWMGVRIQLSLIEYSFDNFCLWCNAQRGKFWIIEEIIDFWYPGFTREHKHKGSISVQLIYSLLFLDSVYVELASALVVWSNPNQSNRRSAVQWYFPPMVSVLWLNPFVFFHLFIYFTVWPSFSHISSKNLRVKYDTPLSTIKQAITYISWSFHCANVLEKKLDDCQEFFRAVEGCSNTLCQCFYIMNNCCTMVRLPQQ